MIRFTEDNTKESDFRVLGHKQPEGTNRGSRCKKAALWAAISAVVLAILAIPAVVFTHRSSAKSVEDFYEPENNSQTLCQDTVITQLGHQDDNTSYTETLYKVINDSGLNLYIPHKAHPTLQIGTPDIHDESIIFAAQAADIRADNGKINGAFVLEGKPIAWGLSKKGFCSIIDDNVTVGVSENSPLFEKATEEGGYFFRQYPLVDNGVLVENEPKGKSIRKALCDRNGEIFIAISSAPESFHDFSQALIDLGVSNAVYIVGSEYSFGFYRDLDGKLNLLSDKKWVGQKYENYIVWRK